MPKGLNIQKTHIFLMEECFRHEFVWVPHSTGKNNGAIDVSSYGNDPYRMLSPFVHNAAYRIPVPGIESIRADSVEGIWQGLKVLHGITDFSLFKGRPRKRRGQPEGHLFGEAMLDYVAARKQIYVPAYVYHVINNALESVKDGLEKRIRSTPVALFDVESNGCIEDTSRPYSHAALLVRVLNFLKRSPLPPFNRKRFTYLHEQVGALLEHRAQLSRDDLDLCDDVITFAYLFSPDELTATFALRAMKEGNIGGKGRLEKYVPTEKTREPYIALRC